VSFVALVVALGGTSYAAFTLPKNSVGTRQIKNKAITNAKLGPNSVGTAKIKDGAVTASKINTSGLTVPNAMNATTAGNATNSTTADTANGLAGVQIVAGPEMSLPGLPGPGTGPTPSGPASIPKGYEEVNCPQGQVAISGGEVNDSDQSANAVTVLNQVRITGFSVAVLVQNGGSRSTSWHAYAVCVKGTSTGSSGSSARPASKAAK
jgi:hypothetical protein